MSWLIYIGIGFIFISGIAVGAWTTAQQQRANFNTEQPSDRRIKSKIATWSLVLGLLSFGLAAVVHWMG
ncbi:DUF5316 domain-containing protein [Paenibacillus glycanilyticus]|uniref:DUF5316 family protein n=1 Tax=Paenibacillus glycanilyticus TaxID=126569 RepID=UPI00203EFD0A|nr:DUF5316 family protein [Paenibacillus glycanilyticus]MCM3627227.1 DUF5316 domain-containing protein [Paenibacillus glycanilyticus]